MAKYINPAVQDAALNDIKNNCNSVVLYAGGSTVFATVQSASVLTIAAASTDFTLGAGSPSGRAVTYGGATGKTVSGAGGSVDSIAFLDTVNSVVLAVSDYTAKTLNTGDTENVSAFALYTIAAPT